MPTRPLDDAIAAAQSLTRADPDLASRLTDVVSALNSAAEIPAPIRALGTSLAAHLDAHASAHDEKSLDAALAVFHSLVSRLEMRRAQHVNVAPKDTSAETVSSTQATNAMATAAAWLAEPSPAPADPAAPPGGLLPPDYDGSLLNDFIAECRDLLEGAESALLQLEAEPDDMDAINTVFRAVHTIKGTSAFLSLTPIASLAHSAEALLDRMRNKAIRCVGGYAGLALQSIDALTDLINRVQRESQGAVNPPLPNLAALTERLDAPEAFGITAQERRETGNDRGDAESTVRSNTMRSADPSVRVRTDRLDRLIEMVGELVIAQSLVSQDDTLRTVTSAASPLARKLSHAAKIVRELQALAMSMRMVPLRGTFQKLKRLTRDLAHRTGKQAALECIGEDTEVDRNLVDLISDPLVHMLRNAIDHGLESPADRAAAGKPETGRITLRASHAGGSVMIELTDDGRGLNRERILGKATQLGLIDPQATLTDAQVWQLIFTPGFSTADQLTDVSGRGVGMDVVRSNIEALRGAVEIESAAGRGTRFSIRLPLTLAITDGMLVRVGAERYVIPTTHIQFSFRPSRAALNTVIGRGEVVVLRDEVLPILRLARSFDVADAADDPAEAVLVVVGDEGTKAAVLVDELLGQQQVVVKSLGAGLQPASGISGGAILGDGRVGLILDVATLLLGMRGAHASHRVMA